MKWNNELIRCVWWFATLFTGINGYRSCISSMSGCSVLCVCVMCAPSWFSCDHEYMTNPHYVPDASLWCYAIREIVIPCAKRGPRTLIRFAWKTIKRQNNHAACIMPGRYVNLRLWRQYTTPFSSNLWIISFGLIFSISDRRRLCINHLKTKRETKKKEKIVIADPVSQRWKH